MVSWNLGLLGTNYAKKVKFLEMIVQSSMLKTDYEMLQYPHCKCNNLLGTLVGRHNFKLLWESLKPLPYQKPQANQVVSIYSSFFKLFLNNKHECFMKRLNNFSIIYLQGEKIEVRTGQSS